MAQIAFDEVALSVNWPSIGGRREALAIPFDGEIRRARFAALPALSGTPEVRVRKSHISSPPPLLSFLASGAMAAYEVSPEFGPAIAGVRADLDVVAPDYDPASLGCVGVHFDEPGSADVTAGVGYLVMRRGASPQFNNTHYAMSFFVGDIADAATVIRFPMPFPSRIVGGGAACRLDITADTLLAVFRDTTLLGGATMLLAGTFDGAAHPLLVTVPAAAILSDGEICRVTSTGSTATADSSAHIVVVCEPLRAGHEQEVIATGYIPSMNSTSETVNGFLCPTDGELLEIAVACTTTISSDVTLTFTNRSRAGLVLGTLLMDTGVNERGSFTPATENLRSVSEGDLITAHATVAGTGGGVGQMVARIRR